MSLPSQAEKELECIDQIIQEAIQQHPDTNPTITDVLHSYDSYISNLVIMKSKLIRQE